MAAEIFGARRAYKIKDPAAVLENIAKKIRESEDPPEYNAEQMEKVFKQIAEAFDISKMNIYLKDQFTKRNNLST